MTQAFHLAFEALDSELQEVVKTIRAFQLQLHVLPLILANCLSFCISLYYLIAFPSCKLAFTELATMVDGVEAHMIIHTIKTGNSENWGEGTQQLQTKQKNECGAKLIHDSISISHMEPKPSGSENITNHSAS
jgi:hypothetical protein